MTTEIPYRSPLFSLVTFSLLTFFLYSLYTLLLPPLTTASMTTENERLRTALTEATGRERVLREQEKHLVSSNRQSQIHRTHSRSED